MNVSTCSRRPLVVPCRLENFEYQVDPYVGCEHNCYYCYALGQAETDWTKEIRIHQDITSQLHEELETIAPQTIYLGYHTDPYQPCESEYRQTRKILEVLVEKGFSASILTKSDLVVRDLDLLKEMGNASVSVSVAFTDNCIRQQFEARTRDTEARIGALQTLRAAGVKTSALICPVIPYMTDVTALIEMLAPHTDVIWIYGLSMRERSDRNWKNVQNILHNHFPDVKAEIETIVFSQDHSYWTQLRAELMEIQEEKRLHLNIHV